MLPIDEFNYKVQRIATALFYTVLKGEKLNKYDHRADLRSGEGAGGLLIYNGGYGNDNRFSVRGYYPADYKGRHHLSGHDAAPSITIAETKTVEAIVIDIKRRLLPGYLETLAKVLERNAKWKQDEESKERALRSLAKALGVHNRDIRMGGEWSVYFHRGSAKIYSGDDVEFKITLPFKSAMQVANLIHTIGKK